MLRYCFCVYICVCGAEIFQGMATQPEGVSGTILEGMRDVREFLHTWLDMCVNMLLWIHMCAYLSLSESVCVCFLCRRPTWKASAPRLCSSRFDWPAMSSICQTHASPSRFSAPSGMKVSEQKKRFQVNVKLTWRNSILQLKSGERLHSADTPGGLVYKKRAYWMTRTSMEPQKKIHERRPVLSTHKYWPKSASTDIWPHNSTQPLWICCVCVCGGCVWLCVAAESRVISKA